MRPNIIALGLLCALTALGLYAYGTGGQAPAISALRPAAPLMSGERPVPPPPPGVALRLPNFDLFRVEPDGEGVAQGRAEALARVSLRGENGADLGSAQADERGEWVVMMKAPLAPGDHLLGLVAEMADGSGVASAEQAVVALAAKPAGRPLVVLTRPGEASRVLQSPRGPETRPLCVEVIDQEREGTMRLGGRADPGRTLYIYGDNRFLAQTSADLEGRWVLSFDPRVLLKGVNYLRFDLLDEKGAVVRRLQWALEGTLYSRARPNPSAMPGLRVLDAGDGWRIIHDDDHQASRWTLILGEQDQKAIDPSRIYPGQVPLTASAAPPAGVVPAADR